MQDCADMCWRVDCDFTYAPHKFAKLQIMISGKLGVLGVPTIHKVGLENVVSWSLNLLRFMLECCAASQLQSQTETLACQERVRCVVQTHRETEWSRTSPHAVVRVGTALVTQYQHADTTTPKLVTPWHSDATNPATTSIVSRAYSCATASGERVWHARQASLALA